MAPKACSTEVAGLTAARRMAAECGSRVEVLGARSPRTQVFAEKSGTLTLVAGVEAERVRRSDGSWAAVDRRLVRAADGTVAPAATVADVRFSGGGDGPLVVWRQGGHVLTMSWPGRLPTPLLYGASAVYREVRPGVDLRMTATAEGFRHVLIVRTREAAADPALREIVYRFGGDVAVAATAEGGLQLSTTSGVFGQAGGAVMWDSAAQERATGTARGLTVDPQGDTPLGAGPGDLGTVTSVPMAVRGQDLVLSPDPATLVDPGVVLPLYIDPSFDGQSPDSYSARAYANSINSNWSVVDPYNGVAQFWVGKNPTGGALYRSVFQFPMWANGLTLVGTRILSARIDTAVDHTWDCSAAQTITLWRTTVISATPRQAWGSTPLAAYLDYQLPTPSNEASCGQADHAFSFSGGLTADLDWFVKQPGISVYPVVISAASDTWGSYEGDQPRWKRFNVSAGFRLVVSFNTYPTVAWQGTNPPTPCVFTPGGGGDTTSLPRINANNGGQGLTLKTAISDVDGGTTQGQFEWWPKASGPMINSQTTNPPVAVGTPVQVTVPPGTFANGTAYSWRVRGYDGTDYGNMSQWCEFVADSDSPDPPSVSPAPGNDFQFADPGDTPPAAWDSAVVGVPSQVTFQPPTGETEIVGYLWGLNASGPTRWAPAGPDGTAVVAIEPVVGGFGAVNELTVQAVDRAGNRSPSPTGGFTVGFKANAAAGWWPTTDSGADHIPDLTENGTDLTLEGNATLGYGVLSVDGNGDRATTSSPVLDTTSSFTVAAWVRPTLLTGHRTAFSQDGTATSAFWMQYRPTENAWCFSMAREDVAPQTLDKACGPTPPVVREWVHLAGVYDAGAAQIRLYINGAFAASRAFTTPWSADGSFAVGRSMTSGTATQHFLGDIADVRAWPDDLDAAGIAALATLPPAAGRWGMDDPTDTAAEDVSGLNAGQAATLSGGAGWAIGHAGMGLTTDGVLADAATGAPVIRTDTAFTVSAWVRVPALPSTWVNAVAQDGSSSSFFGLGIDPANKWILWLRPSDVPMTHVGAVAASGPSPGVWAHLTAVYDPGAVASQVRLYVNGVQAATAEMGTPWQANGAFTIGRGRWAGADNYQWRGDIDDVRAYRGVLTNAQIAYLATL